jgi:hypothetical protein
MNRKTVKYSFFILLTIALMGTVIAWREFNRKIPDTAGRPSAFQLKAMDLIDSFSKNQQQASRRYLDKVIEVDGAVRKVEKDEQGNYTVILADQGTMSAVRCSFDSAHLMEASRLKAGEIVTLKGVCTGFNQDDLLGSDVIMNRCAVSLK